MNLDDFIITCFCWIDEMLATITADQRLRQRGPMPKLSDSEVLTIEVLGSYLGLSQDKKLFAYFRQHYAHFFPALRQVHRSTFVRHAANLWVIKERLWCRLRDEVVRQDPLVGIIDSMPVPVCRFARAPWCRRFPGTASYGKDHADRQTFYGFRLHVRLGWPGVITHVFLAAANEQDGEIAPVVLEGTHGIVLETATIGCPMDKRTCASKAFCCRLPSAKPTRPKRRPMRVRCWDAFAISSIPSLDN